MIVILGAFGKTGSIVASHLETEGKCTVRRVTRNPARKSVQAGREVAVARLSDDAALGAALKGAEALYAILPDDFRAERFHAERRAMADTMARAIRREGVARVVLLSSAAAALGEDGRGGFGADLAYFERLVLDTPAQVTILRASYFQDNVAEVLPVAKRDGVYPNFFRSRDTAIPTIASCDVGAFAAHALLEPAQKDREIVDVFGPSYSPAEMAAVVGGIVGRDLSIVDVPATHQEQTFQQWMSPEAARAMLETLECIGAGRAPPQGDRARRGPTRLEQLLRTAPARTPTDAQQVHS